MEIEDSLTRPDAQKLLASTKKEWQNGRSKKQIVCNFLSERALLYWHTSFIDVVEQVLTVE